MEFEKILEERIWVRKPEMMQEGGIWVRKPGTMREDGIWGRKPEMMQEGGIWVRKPEKMLGKIGMMEFEQFSILHHLASSVWLLFRLLSLKPNFQPHSRIPHPL